MSDEEHLTPSIECSDCRTLISRFVEGSLTKDERESMRAHLKVCDECLPTYQATLTSAARVGQERRTTRLRQEARARRETQRSMALSATGPRRTSRFGLRLVLLPGLMALLIIIASGGFREKPGVQVTWERGLVEAAGLSLDESRREVRIGSGSWCRTGDGAGAVLERMGSSVELGANTAVRVEHDLGPPRMRLHLGELTVHGSVELSTVVGVARLEDGEGTLLLEGTTLHVDCEEGRWIVVGPRGETAVDAGASVSFGRYGEPL